MKRVLFLTALVTVFAQACAQEILDQEQTRRYAEITHRDPKLLQKAPLKITAKLEHAVAAREGDYGGMIIPDANLTADALAKIGSEVLPACEIWLYHLGPMKEGRLIDEAELNIVKVSNDGDSVRLPLCVAGVRKVNDKLELVVYGKGKEPILTLPMKSIDAKQERALAMEAEAGGDSGKITLKLLGKHAATLEVTELMLW